MAAQAIGTAAAQAYYYFFKKKSISTTGLQTNGDQHDFHCPLSLSPCKT
jgi:hypothetical protein